MITIIDDDDEVRSATENLVQSCGLETRVFGSAEAFLDLDTFGETQCIITDVQMPGMSGVEMSKTLLDRGIQLPTIFITAFPEERIRRQAEQLGAVGFLAKPFDAARLLACVDQALELGIGDAV